MTRAICLCMSVLFASACTIKAETTEGNADAEGGASPQAKQGASGGAAGGFDDQNDERVGGAGTSPGTPSTSAGMAGTGSGGADSVESAHIAGSAGTAIGTRCTELPTYISKDVTIGPGCVTMGRTVVSEGSLTILPGTTIKVGADGYLSVRFGGKLFAKGTSEAPILFTSAYESPQAGDWQCLYIDDNTPESEIEYVTFEYAGTTCQATGIEESVAVNLQASLRSFRHVTIRESKGAGLLVSEDAAELRDLSDLTFENIAKSSLIADARGANAFKKPIVLDSDDTAIVVRADQPIDIMSDSIFPNIELPYRLDATLTLDAQLTVEPGVVIQTTAGVRAFLDSSLIAVGTEAEPITWTVPPSVVGTDSWGAIDLSDAGASRLSYNRFEHSVGGVSGAALVVNGLVTLDHLTFSDIQAAAIGRPGTSCVALGETIQQTWCAFSYENVPVRVNCAYEDEDVCLIDASTTQ